MTAIKIWAIGARPRTLAAGVVPVAVGAAVAVGQDSTVSTAGAWGRTGLALVVALALQVGVNFANDYSDGVRGVDDSSRIGPRRLVGSGLVAPHLLKQAAISVFLVAAAAGTALAALAGWQLLIVGALCLLAGWGYTGGPRPYGYLGLGEVFVFVFFGLVATAGTSYVLLERLDWLAVVCGVPVGLWAVALLITNNLRDLQGDAAAGKRTLAVRLGDRRTRLMYVGVLEASYGVALLASISGRAAAAAVLGAPFALSAVRSVLRGASGADLIGVLGATARAQLVSGMAMAAGIALTA